MSRGSDPFWSYVEEMADGSLKCVFCKRIYPKTTAPLRIKHHLAGVKGGGTTLCEKVTPDAQRAMLDQLPNRMHVSMPSSEMQGQPLLDVDLSTWVDSLILPDALETVLETEPADQPFEMDMNNIPSSLMRDVEFSRGKEKMTWELMPSVAERGSSSKRPVDRSVPSSSNNEATNAASTPFRGLAIEQDEQPCLDEATPDVQRAAFDQLPNRMHVSMPSSEMQGQPLLDDELLWLNSLMEQEILLTDENVAPGMPMPDAPETGLGTEPADQPFEMDMNNISSSLMRDVECSNRMTWEFTQSVAERGSSSKRPVDRSVPSSSNNEQPRLDDGLGGMDILIGGETELIEEPRAAVVLMTEEPETRQRTEQAHQSFETNTKSISSSSMMDDVLRMCRNIMSQEYKPSVVERGSSSESPAHKRRRTRRYVLPTTKLVGQAFERNMKDVWSWLLNDEVSSIGIYGMGGVGKTALATHIHNQLHNVCQERQDIFHHVCWITVPQDFSIEALQDCIVEQMKRTGPIILSQVRI